MLIYIDGGRTAFLTPLNIEHTVTNNLDEYLASTVEKKVAVTFERFGCNYSVREYRNYLERITTVSQASLAVFIFDSELHDSMALTSAYAPVTNVYWVTSGIINNINVKQINNGDFFNRICNIYKYQLPDKLDLLNPYQVKPYYFDALLGETKPHRTLIYNNIKQNINDKVISSYRPDMPSYTGNIYKHSSFILEPGTEILAADGNTNALVKYFGIGVYLSYIIPLEVYNKTAYSIVAETNYDNEYSFFTEKIAKPIAAQRLFVVFSGQGFLRNLRSMGFCTFDGIIDESYDQVEDSDQRFDLAMEQVKWLCSQPQEHILARIQPIVEHNKQVLMSSNFTQDTLEKIVNIIYGNY